MNAPVVFYRLAATGARFTAPPNAAQIQFEVDGRHEAATTVRASARVDRTLYEWNL
jgi:hypothetical protein